MNERNSVSAFVVLDYLCSRSWRVPFLFAGLLAHGFVYSHHLLELAALEPQQHLILVEVMTDLLRRHASFWRRCHGTRSRT